MAETFTKDERICSKRLIDQLFAAGNASMAVFPLRAVYMPMDDGEQTTDDPSVVCDSRFSRECPPLQVLISVPKRHFHHAVDRNRVKRQVREAYRQNRHLLADVLAIMPDRMLLLSFIWMADRHLPSSDVAQRLQHLLARVATQLSSAASPASVTDSCNPVATSSSPQQP